MADNVMPQPLSGDEHVDAIVKKIYSNAGRFKIALTPEPYEIWYEFFSGINTDLTKEIKTLLKAGKEFTPALHKELYRKYFSPKNTGVMDQVYRETQSMISKILSELLKAGKNTTDFGEKLDSYSQKVHGATDATAIKQIIKNMVQDTSTMISSSSQLEEQLSEATREVGNLKAQLKEIKKDASLDALTGINNRKSFDQKIKKLMHKYQETNTIFSAIFADIDFFKEFNDTYGHKIGDLVLKIVATTLHRGVKGGDFPARYGGEEFVILLPATPLEKARIVAEQLRVLISVKKPTNPLTGQVYRKITASFGVSEVRQEDTAASLIDRADTALYLAKQSGRNNVKTEQDVDKISSHS
ncbi:MAG: GGDEF domain-containing protein [Desulfobulbaceae bacterium]|nr:GGDEF domain-containing protein [Desulfobulbaceae bacterium]